MRSQSSTSNADATVDAGTDKRRRSLLRGAAVLPTVGALAGLGLSARAQERYPERPVRMLVAFPAGGATDILARLIGQGMSAQLGQPIVVENKPGAGGMIGLDAAAKSQADGYNLFFCALTNQAIAGHLYPNATADISRDFAPIALLANGGHVLNVHPAVPARNMTEFIAWLKANDGTVNYASQGNGTLSHLEAELLQQRLGIKAVHVPYRGSSQALPDLVSGKVSFMFDSIAASQTFVTEGKLRALAVATGRRVSVYPDLPTVSEAGVPGYDADNWFGLFAPRSTPPQILARLSEMLGKVLADPALVDNLLKKGYVTTYGDAQRLAAVTTADRKKWGEVIKAAKITI